MGWLLSLGVVGVAAQPVCEAGQLPAHIEIAYDAHAQRGRWFSLAGEVQLLWQREGDARYALASLLTSAGMQWLAQRSEGLIVTHASPANEVWLRPQRYSEQRAWRQAQHTQIDWAAGTVVLGDSVQASTQPGMQDRISALMQLSLHFRRQPDAPTVEFAVASRSRVARYRFVRHESGPIKLPMGQVEAVRFERVDDDGDAIEVWLAPAHCALPVRVRWRDH
ncbi:MAG TPA: DUF3108 domain-containing protein, partial [Burkholderiaceae bacterium]|nr:DUF3108 domain-containing protein [Burkholderiaceae bacterium]